MNDTDISKRVELALTVQGKGRNHGRLAPKTARQYGKYWGDAQSWLTSVGLSTVTAWSSETLAQYAGVLLEDGYAVSTVDSRLTAIKAGHRNRGWPVPDGVAAWFVLRGGNPTANDPVKVSTRRPRRADLADALANLNPETAAGARDICLGALGWDLMARVTDLRGVDLADVVVTDEGTLSVRLAGRWLPVEHLHEPVDVCPVEATLAWIGWLRGDLVTEGPLFRGVDKGGNIAGTGGPYAGHREALRLTQQGLQLIWNRLAVQGGLPSATARDLRLASSLEAAAAGVPLAWIFDRGGWSPRGPVLARLFAAANPVAVEGDDDGEVDQGPGGPGDDSQREGPDPAGRDDG